MYILVLSSPILSEPGIHRIARLDDAWDAFIFNCIHKLEAETGINDILLMEFLPGQSSATTIAHVSAFKDDDGEENWFNYLTRRSLEVPVGSDSTATRDFLLKGVN